MAIQKNWFRCTKCQGLFFAADVNNIEGVCPAGQEHEHTGSWNYGLMDDLVFGPAPSQKDWRWCRKCEGLYYPGALNLGVCPAGQTHDHTGSGNYWLSIGNVAPKGSEGNWRWCHKCTGLYFAGGPTQGVCPAKGPHDSTNSEHYLLSHL